MLSNTIKKTKDLLYYGKPFYTKRYFKNWSVVVREQQATYTVERFEYSENLGGYLMKIIDYSGKNHMLLVRPSDNPDYFEVLGTFSSSDTPFNNTLPYLVSSYNLEDANKKQFLYRYNKKIFIKKTDVEHCQIETKVLDDPQYTSFCEQLAKGTLKDIQVPALKPEQPKPKVGSEQCAVKPDIKPDITTEL